MLRRISRHCAQQPLLRRLSHRWCRCAPSASASHADNSHDSDSPALSTNSSIPWMFSDPTSTPRPLVFVAKRFCCAGECLTPMAERTIAWLARDNRRRPYRSTRKTGTGSNCAPPPTSSASPAPASTTTAPPGPSPQPDHPAQPPTHVNEPARVYSMVCLIRLPSRSHCGLGMPCVSLPIVRGSRSMLNSRG